MFGYVLPQKCEMKVKDFEAYRAYYCGVCKQLGRSYGTASRFLLNYDLVLLGVLTDALSGEMPTAKREGCFATPLAKRQTFYATRGLQLAATGLVLLSYYRLQDSLQDEKHLKRAGYALAAPALRGMHKKAAAALPAEDAVVAAQMQRQQALEAAGCQNVDEAADPTAHMCAALFAEAAQDDETRHTLYRLGLFAGQVVYLLDAAEDYADDEKQGKYNVFLAGNVPQVQAVEQVRTRCNMAAGEIARCYSQLKPKQYKDILDNIFYLGLPSGIAGAGTKHNRRSAGHGQIESV